MNEYKNKPAGFAVCTAAEGACPLRERCLRNAVYQEVAKGGSADRVLPMVNLHNPELDPFTERCQMFSSATPVRFARGMKHLFDHVPRDVYPSLQASVEACFSSRRTYYYFKRGDRLISPATQEAIAAFFRQHGIKEQPQFDEYETEFAWK